MLIHCSHFTMYYRNIILDILYYIAFPGLNFLRSFSYYNVISYHILQCSSRNEDCVWLFCKIKWVYNKLPCADSMCMHTHTHTHTHENALLSLIIKTGGVSSPENIPRHTHTHKYILK